MNRNSQKGFVSIIVSIIIMTILSLITIGFAQLMAREQRQALDRQLSSQAFYAAESGVNDALVDPAGLTANSCAGSSRDVDTSLGVRVPCITFSQVSDNFTDDAVSPDQHTPEVFPLPANTARVDIEFWSPTATSAAGDPASGSTSLPAANAWTNRSAGMLKVHLAPFAVGDDRGDIVANARSLLIMPTTAGASTTTYNGTFGRIVSASCTGTIPARRCRTSITGLPTSRIVTMVLSSIYTTNSVDVRAYSSTGVLIPFNGVQKIIDATGRTSDVARRIQVRVSNIEPYYRPSGGIETFGNVPGGGVCKLIEANQTRITDACGYFNNATTLIGGVSVTADPNGLSEFTPNKCNVTDCEGDSDSPDPNTVWWGVNFYNSANNPASIVAGCSWNFGDGTVVQNQACLFGEKIFHDYGQTNPIQCRTFRVVLTMRFNNGAANRDYPSNITSPSGPGSPC